MNYGAAAQPQQQPMTSAFGELSMNHGAAAQPHLSSQPHLPPPPPTAAATAAAAAAEPLLSVIVPGRAMMTSWQIMEPTRATLAETITNANEVPDVMVALLPDRAILAVDQAAIIYWTHDGVNWSLLGAVAQQKPSAMLRTGWGTALEPGAVVQLAVSIEPMEIAANLGLELLAAGGNEERRNFARAIASDVWRYLTSFSQTVQSNGEMMLIPTNVLDNWMKRFDRKYAVDPNFMLKVSD